MNWLSCDQMYHQLSISLFFPPKKSVLMQNIFAVFLHLLNIKEPQWSFCSNLKDSKGLFRSLGQKHTPKQRFKSSIVSL